MLILTLLNTVIVFGQGDEVVYADDIWLSYSMDEIRLYYNEGENFYQGLDIYYKVLPEDVTDNTVFVTLTDESVATINHGDDYFTVTAKKEGRADLFVISSDERVTKSFNVIVEASQTRVEDFNIIDDYIELSLNEVKDLSYEIYPENAFNKNVHWCFQEKSEVGAECISVEDDKSVVEVFRDVNGRLKLKGVGKGVVNLVGITEDKGYNDNVIIVVDGGQIPGVEPLEDVEIIPHKDDILVGDNINLMYKVSPLNGDVSDLIWYSENPDILEVYPNGYAIAKASGTVRVGIKSNRYNVADTLEIKVLESAPIVYVTDIVTLYNDITLYKGQNMYLDYTIKPENATDKGVRCISLNTGVARVIDDKLCQITAVKEGEAFIDIISNDYRARSTIKVIVEDPSKDDDKKDVNDIRDIYFLKSKETIEVDETKQLRVFSIPFRPTIDNLYFYSSDYDIVDVDDKGVIKGVSRGRAVVTAITADGLTDRVVVEVNEKEVLPKDLSIKVEDKYLDDKVDKIELNMGDSKYLQPVFQPADTTFTDIIWKSSDSKVVSINNNGLLKAVGPGEATITAQVRGTTLEVKLNVKVNYSESYWLTIDQGIADGDRDFIVIFSMNIRDSKSNKEKIYITTDPTGNNKDSLAVPVINNNEVVFKVPKQGWSRGEDYYIFIEEGVESVNGDLIKKGVRYKFKIRGAL